jgi:hypothetical protein
MGADTVKIFCPKCQCVYHHPPPVRSRSSHNHGGAGAAGVDGAAFGTTFPHLFLMTFSNLVPDRLPTDSAYVPRVFGFRVTLSARQRTSSGASSGLGLVAAATTNSRNLPNDNNKRLSFTRRSDGPAKESADRRPKEEESAAVQDGGSALPAQDATNDTIPKGVKGTGASSTPTKDDNEENSTKDDDGNKKSKAGKRRNDAEAATKKSEGNGTVLLDNSSKRRRKGDTGNGNV